jgi:hypothetical protein
MVDLYVRFDAVLFGGTSLFILIYQVLKILPIQDNGLKWWFNDG